MVTYDLQLDPNLAAGEEIVNNGGIKHYSATEGGGNYSPGDDYDDASTTVKSFSIEKNIVWSEYDDGEDNKLTEATIGEKVRYRVEVTVPETNTDNVVLTDRLEDGSSKVVVRDRIEIDHPLLHELIYCAGFTLLCKFFD